MSESRVIYSLAEHATRIATRDEYFWGTAAEISGDNLWVIRMNPRSGLPSEAPVRRTRWADFRIDHLGATADGTKVSFLRKRLQSNIWTGALKANGAGLAALRRFTSGESFDYPFAWTADSKAVLFTSDRGGSFEVYRQDLDKDDAEVLTSVEEMADEVRLSPDGKWLLYLSREPRSTKSRLMRLPLAGGAPEQVAEPLADAVDMHCSRAPGGPLRHLGEARQCDDRVALGSYQRARTAGSRY